MHKRTCKTTTTNRRGFSHNEKLLDKFKSRATCSYILKKTGLNQPQELADLFNPLNLSNDNLWPKYASGERRLFNKISLIENAHKIPFELGGSSAKFKGMSKADYQNLYMKISNVRCIYEEGPEIEKGNYVPLWPSMSENIDNFYPLLDKFKESIPWPKEAIKYSILSHEKYDKYLEDNPEATIDTLPYDYYPIDPGNACLCIGINQPKLSNWHKLTLLIILFRCSVEYECSELRDVASNLGWNHVDGIHDEAIGISYISEETSKLEIESMFNFTMPFTLSPLNLNFLKTEIINQLNSMEENLAEYGLSADDVDFYFRQLYSSFFLPDVTLNRLKTFHSRKKEKLGTNLGQLDKNPLESSETE